MNPKLTTINSPEDIPADYQNTPIADLLLYHNLNQPHKTYDTAELLIGMCMDNRKSLDIPQNFAYIIRAGGANLQNAEFKVSFAIAMAGIQHIALIGHTQCGMVDLASKKEQFISGLCEHAGWSLENAEQHFTKLSPRFEISNELDFILSESIRLRIKYPKVKIAPLLYKVEDNRIYFITEE